MAAVAALTGCGGSDTPSEQPPSGGGGTTVKGTEKMAWDQPAPSTAELAQYTYVVYVDGTRTTLSNATCGSTAAQTGYPCTAPLPTLSVGQHTLQVAAVISSGGTTVEGDRSTAITVTRTASLTSVGPAGSANAGSRASVLSDAASADEIGNGLAAPTSLAPTPDGRVFIATRTGIVVLQNGRVADPPALRIDQVIVDERYELDLALAPRFADSHFVFLSQTAAATSGGSVTKITRYREVQGLLGEAVVLRELPLGSSAGRTRIRVGPDEKLYVAISDEATGNPDSSAYEGALLRLNLDGSTPADNPGGSPILSHGYVGVRAMDWDAAREELWIAQSDPLDPGHATTLTMGARLAPRAGAASPAARPARFALPQLIDVTGVAFSAAGLFAAGRSCECLYSVDLDAAGQPSVTTLFQGRYGPIGEVAAEDSGWIDFSTTGAPSGSADPAPGDRLLRFKPAR